MAKGRSARRAAAAGLGLLVSWAVVPPAAAEPVKAILVLDASGSMWGQVDGRAKIAIAKDTVSEILGNWRPENALGLVVYGHRSKGDCADIEVVREPGPVDVAAFKGSVAGITPKGKTPMTAAVRQAAEALKFTEGPATVILVSDGEETCGLDPCAVAEELAALGVGLTVHTVGFDLKSDAARAQLACLAEKTGGRYIDAKNAGDLGAALNATVAVVQAPVPPVAAEPAAAPEPPPAEEKPAVSLVAEARLVAGGTPIAEGVSYDVYRAAPDGTASDEGVGTFYDGKAGLDLPPGAYVVRARMQLAGVDVPVTIVEGETARIEAVLDAGTIVARGYRREGDAEPVIDITWQLTTSAGDTDTRYDGELVAVVPAGTQTLRAAIGQAATELPVEVTAGQTAEYDIVVEAGVATASALFAPGGPKATKNIKIDIVRGEGDAAETVDYTYDPEARFVVSPGSYRIVAYLGQARAEMPITVTAGDTSSVVVVVNAGLARVGGDGVTFIEIFGGAEDIYGDKTVVTYAYDAKLEAELAAGDYVAVGHREDGSKTEVPFTVVAGKRAEVKLP